MGTLEYANRAAEIVRWTATPEAERADPVKTALAAETLAWWGGAFPEQYQPSMFAKMAYGKAYADTFIAKGLEPAPFKWPGDPWVAFTFRGPGLPPPAVQLMRRAEEEPGGVAAALWDALYTWTGPGWAYQIFVENKVPTNGLLNALETTMGKVAKMGGEAVGAAAGGVSSLLWGAAAVGLVYLLVTRRKPERRR